MSKENLPTPDTNESRSIWSAIFGNQIKGAARDAMTPFADTNTYLAQRARNAYKKGVNVGKTAPKRATANFERAKEKVSPAITRQIGRAALAGTTIKNKSLDWKSNTVESAKNTAETARENVRLQIGKAALAGSRLATATAEKGRAAKNKTLDSIDRGVNKSKETYVRAQDKVVRGLGRAAYVATNPKEAFKEFQANEQKRAIERAQQNWYASGPNDKPIDRMDIWAKYTVGR